MENVNFLNLEYLLLRVYKIFTGAHVAASDISGQVAAFWSQLTIAGLALAFMLFALAVWFRVRTVLIEHEGFHRREEKEHHKAATLEEAKGNARWKRVVERASSGDESSWRLAIIEADSMLAELLVSEGYPGETVGDQLKNANPLQFTTLDLAWQAHKVRNAIAHLGEAYPLSEREVRATVDLYARVFEEFGII